MALVASGRVTVEGGPVAPARALRNPPAVLVFVVTALAVFAAHLQFLHLPYYWDEAGHFIPAASDILLHCEWIPSSTVPNIHPPAVPAYVALAWKVAGDSVVTTRVALLLLAAACLWATWLLGTELLPQKRRAGWFAVLALFVSPLFFMQSMLAQLDLPATVFTVLALCSFLRGRIALSASICVVLVMVKETGIAVPLVFGVVLLSRHRWRDATWFTLPALVLGLWVAILEYRTGHWAGSAEFAAYNLWYPLKPLHLLVSLLRRLYYLMFAGTHWIGAAAVVYAWTTRSLFRSRGWSVAGLLVLGHVILVILLGGAALERYLLPVLPVVYLAMAAGIFALPRVANVLCGSVMIVGLAAGNWINPPYPFPYEDNLALVDFVKLQSEAAAYLSRSYSGARIETAWLLTLELSRPDLGFVLHPITVMPLRNYARRSMEAVHWHNVPVFVAFSKTWDPPVSLMHFGMVHSLWKSAYGDVDETHSEIAAAVPFPRVAHFERRGQWVDIFVNPGALNSEHRIAAAYLDTTTTRHTPSH